ncbi:MAG: alanine--tRNA ligase [bacterium]|nr:alanine--tRNA ligase [bacterium]
MTTGNEIRERFLSYFEARGHARVASSSLVPQGDPTLLFTNAGMVQFKDVFLGLEARPYRRAVTSQKCVRAGGKHNDLDQVGRTARHHTFFEMLGNFSFGDYFKEQAIGFAWEFVTDKLGLEPDRVWPTIYRDDEEAFGLWRKVAGVPAGRIVRLGEKDNFWSMGDTGPCGPCSEMVYDRGPEAGCGRPDCGIGVCDCDRWLEIWNLVFMQFDRDQDGAMTPLPRPSIDTGMGLERVASVLQGAASNYETDLFRPLLCALEERTGRGYDPGPAGFPFRVIADHVRTCTFLIGDGAVPGNEGRGYVVRRILRRAVRFGRVLGLEEPFLEGLVPVVVRIMGEAYPELGVRAGFVGRVIRAEEERFTGTLAAGLRRAEEMVEAARSQGRRELAGDEVFILHDTFGFPLDLAEDIAGEHGLEVDRAGFAAAMERQRERGRSARTDEDLQIEAELRAVLADAEPTVFVGYERTEGECRVLVLLEQGRPVDEAAAPAEVEVILDRTPFYAEAGGQVGDAGTLTGDGLEVQIVAVHRWGDGPVLHHGRVISGSLRQGDVVQAAAEPTRRLDVARNHTATHLLHAALRKALGEHVAQAGSLVAPERLRFDFVHFEPMTADEVARVEGLVNEWVLHNLPVECRETSYQGAVAEGAIALFGEKYADRVRVVGVGEISRELCGGTHIRRTGEVGLFKIVGESGIGSGLRRVEAVTGRGLLSYLAKTESCLAGVAGFLKTAVDDVPARVSELVEHCRDSERRLEQAQGRLAVMEAEKALGSAVQAGDSRLVAAVVALEGQEALRAVSDIVRERIGSGVAILAARDRDRVQLVAAVTADLVARGVHAGRLIALAAREVGGGGGGRPDMAQAGGSQPDHTEAALAAGLAEARRMLGDTVS